MLSQATAYAKLAAMRSYVAASRLVSLDFGSASKRVPHYYQAQHSSGWMGWASKLSDNILAFTSEPTLVLDSLTCKLWLGSAMTSAQHKTYDQLGVSHVINCASSKDCLPVFFSQMHLQYLCIAMEDDSSETIDFVDDKRILHDLHGFLCRAQQSDRPNILVHCVFGRSRSVAVTMLIVWLHQVCQSNHTNQTNQSNQSNQTGQTDQSNQTGQNQPTMLQIYNQLAARRKCIAVQECMFRALERFVQHFNSDAEFAEHWRQVFVRLH